MKKLTLLLLLFTTVSFSQIKKVESSKSELIGKISQLGESWIEITKAEDFYNVVYKDMKFQHLNEYKSFMFQDIDNAFDNLYDTIMDGFENMPEQDIRLDLPNDIIWLSYKKSFGVVNLEIYHAVNSNPDVLGKTTWLTKKKAMKLFGKKKKKK